MVQLTRVVHGVLEHPPKSESDQERPREIWNITRLARDLAETLRTAVRRAAI